MNQPGSGDGAVKKLLVDGIHARTPGRVAVRAVDARSEITGGRGGDTLLTATEHQARVITTGDRQGGRDTDRRMPPLGSEPLQGISTSAKNTVAGTDEEGIGTGNISTW